MNIEKPLDNSLTKLTEINLSVLSVLYLRPSQEKRESKALMSVLSVSRSRESQKNEGYRG